MLISVEGPAAAEQAWERYTDPGTWPTWAPQISRVDIDDGFARGARGTVHGPLLLRVPFRIRDVDPAARRWSWSVGLGVLSIRMDHGVDATPTGCRAWARIQAPRLVVLPYVPIARVALRRLVRG